MHPNVEKLIQLLPPPAEPKFNRGDWGEVEAVLGTKLPQDFRDFTEAYGSVTICKTYWFHTPFYFVGENSYVPFSGQKEDYRELLMSSLAELRRMTAVAPDLWTGGIPQADFPEAGGLLPIGTVDYGDKICWITNGGPDNWGTFYWGFSGMQVHSFPKLNLTGFLLDLLNLTSPLFSSGLDPSLFDEENREVG